MKSSEIQGNTILLLGYGRENQSVHRFLIKHYPQVRISIADIQPVTPVADVDHVYTGKGYLREVSQFDTIVRSPGIPSTIPELTGYEGIRTTATNIFFSHIDGAVVIGVTGTKGKSTTSSLIAAILKQKFTDVRLVGNIGTPALDHMDDINSDTYIVAELSSHQLEDCTFSPRIAVILDVVAEHLDYYKTFDEYKKAKSRIIQFQTNQYGSVIYNPDHQIPKAIAESSRGKHITFTLYSHPDSSVWVEHDTIMKRWANGKTDKIISTSEIPIPGKGNIENVLASVAATAQFDISPELISQAIRQFKTLPHRLEKVGVYRGITFYNDSLATVPEATIHALDALGENVETLIVGGFNRGVSYTKLSEVIDKHPTLKNLILFPDTGKIIWDTINEINIQNQNVRVTRVGGPPRRGPLVGVLGGKPAAGPASHNFKKFDVTTMEDAVKLAYLHTQPGKICLMSPASASFNLFKDYADRGDQFKHYVTKYPRIQDSKKKGT